MMWIQEQAEEKLTVYWREAALRRQLPTGVWRAQVARALRDMAERLEPISPTTVSERLT